LRHDNSKFAQRDTVVISVGPENANSFKKYWLENGLTFFGLPDENHSVIKLYGQEVKLFKLGRQPAQMLIDKAGILRYVHYGHSMSDIPTTEEMIELLDKLQAEKV